MKNFKPSCGLVLLLSACQTNQEKKARTLVGSWAVSPNHLFSYAQMYFYKDYTCFYFSLETGNNQLGKYRMLANTLFAGVQLLEKLTRYMKRKFCWYQIPPIPCILLMARWLIKICLQTISHSAHLLTSLKGGRKCFIWRNLK